MELGVNIDHIATLREARKINDPDPLEAIFIAKRAGASQITIHLREDRRHIHDTDVKRILESSFLPVNVESSIDPDIISFLCELRPQRITLVPEKREEVTTEGGLNVLGQYDKVRSVISRLQEREIEVSLFIDPDKESIDASKELGAQMVELHTGAYANVHLMLHSNLPHTQHSIKALELPRHELNQKLFETLEQLRYGATVAYESGLKVAAGHGLNYNNVRDIAEIPEIFELNIGQSIIARSVFTGLEQAIREMVDLLG